MRERDRVDAEVEERAAGQRRVEQTRRRVVLEELAVVRGQSDHGADLPGVHDLVQRGHVRQEAGPHRLHHEHPALPGGREHLLGLGHVAGERLLDQHVLARLDGQQRVVTVLGVRGGDVDRLDRVVGTERLVGVVHGATAVRGRERLAALAGAGADGGDLAAGAGQQGIGERGGDATGAEDAPAQRRGLEGIGDGHRLGPRRRRERSEWHAWVLMGPR